MARGPGRVYMDCPVNRQMSADPAIYKGALDIAAQKCYSKSMKLQWDMIFVDAAKGLPADTFIISTLICFL